MANPTSNQVTTILGELAAGDDSAAHRLLPLVYDELRQLASDHMRRERVGHTLQPTALAHEAFLRLANLPHIQWRSRAQFLAIAARAIRQILVDHARTRQARKRGGDWLRITLGDQADWRSGSQLDTLALDDALNRLAALSERQAQVVELRFFGGLSVEETAHVIGVSERTVKGDWKVARAWLWRELGEEAGR